MKLLKKIIEYGFYVFIFLLPWQTRLIWNSGEFNGGFFEYGSMSLYATEILLLIILLLAGIWFLGNRLNINEQMPIVWYIVAFFELSVFISIFWSFDKNFALYGWYRVVLAIGLFWLVSSFPISFRKIKWAFVSSAAVQSVFALWQFFSQTTFANKWLGLALHNASDAGVFVVEGAGRFLRAYGSLPHPNMLGGFLAVAILLLLGLWFDDKIKNTKLRIVNCALLILISAGLFVSFSRSAWLALVFSLIFIAGAFIYKKINLRNFVKPLAIIAIVFIILGTMFSDLFFTRLGGEQRLEQISTEQRIEYFSEAGKILSEYWTTGVGIGNYTLAIYNQIDSGRAVWDYQPVHNIYILIFAELGIAGIFIFFFFIIYILWLTAKKLVAGNNKNLIFASAALLLLLLVGLFDHYLWTLYFGVMLLWFSLGLWYKTIKN